MRTRVVLGVAVAVAALVAAALWYALFRMPETRLRAGLEGAGFSPRVADCMARRMVKRLSYAQLLRLADLAQSGKGKSRAERLHNLHALADPEIDTVTLSSAALCATGIAH